MALVVLNWTTRGAVYRSPRNALVNNRLRLPRPCTDRSARSVCGNLGWRVGGALSGCPARAGGLTSGALRRSCVWRRDRRGRAPLTDPPIDQKKAAAGGRVHRPRRSRSPAQRAHCAPRIAPCAGGGCGGGPPDVSRPRSPSVRQRERAEHAQRLHVVGERGQAVGHRGVAPHPGPRRTCSCPSPRLRGRDSIRVRLTPAAGELAQAGDQPPGCLRAGGAPEHDRGLERRVRPGLSAAGTAGRLAGPAQPHEPGLVVGHVLDAGQQHLAAVALGGHAGSERGPRAVVGGDGPHRLGGRAAGHHLGVPAGGCG